MVNISALWDQLIDCICRPPRDEYEVHELIGGATKRFKFSKFEGYREDFELVNKHGLKLKCSHFLPTNVEGKDGRLPCVIYCHCNSGSRRDAEEAVYILIPLGVSVFTLDFEGSGLSDGNYVTLGANEVEDLEVAVKHLRDSGKVSTLGLWGRSMGAVTSLLYSCRDPSIAGIVLDSPFSKLTDLMLEIVEEQKLPIPRAFFKMVLSIMKRSVKKRAGFDINKICPLDVVKASHIPALFAHAHGDSFIKIHHSERLYAAYAGEDKNLIRFDGDHNSRRPEFFYNSVSIFFHNTLQLDKMLVGGNRLSSQYDLASQRSLQQEASLVASQNSATHTASMHQLQWHPHNHQPRRQTPTGIPPELLDDEVDAELLAAIELSLQDAQQSDAGASSPHVTLAGTHTSVNRSTTAEGQEVSTPLTGVTVLLPSTQEQEEEMLQRALEASLLECMPTSSSNTMPSPCVNEHSSTNTAGREPEQVKTTSAALSATGQGQTPADRDYVDLLVSELGNSLAAAQVSSEDTSQHSSPHQPVSGPPPDLSPKRS